MARACLAGAAAIAALVAVSPATGTESATRIIDRTVICKPAGIGYPESVRILGASVQPFQASRGGAPQPPMAYVYTPQGGEGLSAGLRTGRGSGYSYTTGAVWLGQTGCRPTRIRLPLSSKGLRGGPTEPFCDSYRCDVPATVLIRVRAEFKRPTALRRDPQLPSVSVAKGDIETGYLAMTTLRGRKPLLFASVRHATGKARAFAAPSHCVHT